MPWFEAFGMTETGADIRVSPDDHDELVGSGCLGRPAAHREVRIDDGGQLWLRGPGHDGRLPGASRTRSSTAGSPPATWPGSTTQGRVYLEGRLKDMIRRSGENIAAREVEDVLLAHPAVRLAAVVGVPDEIRGEEVKAYVVAPGASADELAALVRRAAGGVQGAEPLGVPRRPAADGLAPGGEGQAEGGL